MFKKFLFASALILWFCCIALSVCDDNKDVSSSTTNEEIPVATKNPSKGMGNKLFPLSQGIAGAVTKTISLPIDTASTISNKIKSVVTKNQTVSEEDNNKKPESEKDSVPEKESGKLDFFGRDVVRATGKAIGKVSNTVANATTKIISKIETTVGLDLTIGKDVKNESEFRKRVQAIYPGTKWCGGGNKARNDEDLGYFATTDACCREHDNCPLGIPAGETKFGLHNTGLFTRSHCDCDTKFYKCLKEADNIIATKIGITYFSVLGPQCFKEDYPLSACAKRDGERCSEYLSDNSQEKRYQWFDAPNF